MARLNEPPVSCDSLETLRKKMLRQNRDLAKSNNIRALRIRELENECACMLSENLELRGRILELEKQVEDNDARRIADHALAIKAKLESQLTECGILLAGLGLEPPTKRHSPRIRRPLNQRMSFNASRSSPSQRRLRDVARDIEELGHISENKSYPRKTMNPDQILALRSEADSADSPEIGPPPMSKFIDEDPIKVDSPSRAAAVVTRESTPEHMEPPVSLPTPKFVPTSKPERIAKPPPAPSPETKIEPVITQQLRLQPDTTSESTAIKSGSKRKFATRDDTGNATMLQISCDNQAPISMIEKQPLRERAELRPLKELAHIRKEGREKRGMGVNARKPLAAKSTNDDISSPRKTSKPAMADEVAAAKADLANPRAPNERSKPKARDGLPAKVETVPVPDIPPPRTAELATPVVEPALLSPSSPEPPPDNVTNRGDTPPPADISYKGEISRPSRRNRAAISYAEPNLRAKMRRPTKELLDAVAGEGKYSRRSSQAELLSSETLQVKREVDAGDLGKRVPAPDTQPVESEAGGILASPLASKSASPQELPNNFVTDRRRRPSSVSLRAAELVNEGTVKEADKPVDSNANPDTSGSGDVDIYEFTSSSAQVDKEVIGTKKTRQRQTTSSRRPSAAVDDEKGLAAGDRSSARRRSIMI